MKKLFHPADILLPDFSKIDASLWPVIACDQHTSEPEYWNAVAEHVNNAPSTLDLILPEAYLDRTDELVPKINDHMRNYLKSVLIEHKASMIYVERTLTSGETRRGVVGAIDLELYSYNNDEKPLIRATEGTVLERIPPRVAVRRYAKLELPHVMLLIDDPERRVIEPLANAELETAYDIELMMDGGHVKGKFLTEDEIERVNAELNALMTPEALKKRYGFSDDPMCFAVGDGNHSLATAKACYEEIKYSIGKEAALNHPARYALVEMVNLHDDAIRFEPIYRVMFDVDAEQVVLELRQYCDSLRGKGAPQEIEFIGAGERGMIKAMTPTQQLPVGTLQMFIDDYCEMHPRASVDYIHGEDATRRISRRENAIGFIFDGMTKSQLFKTVMLDGALQRKTFSMGHACDKRYYLESRRIKK